MNYEVLLKVPCIIVVTTAFQIAFIPPTGPPNKSEGDVPSTRWEGMLRKFVIPSLPIVMFFLWIGSFLEGAAFIALRYPEHVVAQKIAVITLVRNINHDLALSWMSIFSTIIVACGGIIRWLCYRQMGHLFTFPISVREDHRLIKTGPYAFVRHPGYVGTAVTITGMYLWYSSPGSWVRESELMATVIGKLLAIYVSSVMLFAIIGLACRIPKEDQAMKSRFGKEWVEWAGVVPYRLIPNIY